MSSGYYYHNQNFVIVNDMYNINSDIFKIALEKDLTAASYICDRKNIDYKKGGYSASILDHLTGVRARATTHKLYSCYMADDNFDITETLKNEFFEGNSGGDPVEKIAAALNSSAAAQKLNITFTRDELHDIALTKIANDKNSGNGEMLFALLPADVYYGNNNGYGDIRLKDGDTVRNYELKSVRKFACSSSASIIDERDWNKSKVINERLSASFARFINDIKRIDTQNEAYSDACDNFSKDVRKNPRKGVQGKKTPIRIMLGTNQNRRQDTMINKNGERIVYSIHEIIHDIPQSLYKFVKDKISRNEYNAIIRRCLKKFMYSIYLEDIPTEKHNELEDLFEKMFNNEFDCFNESSFIFKGYGGKRWNEIKPGEIYQADDFYAQYCLFFIRRYMKKSDALLYLSLVEDKNFYVVVREDDCITDKLLIIYIDTHDCGGNPQRGTLRALPNPDFIKKSI